MSAAHNGCAKVMLKVIFLSHRNSGGIDEFWDLRVF